MSSALGIVILVLFSLGLTLFMRLDLRGRRPDLPQDLGRWVRCDPPVGVPCEPSRPDSFFERRVVLIEGGLLRRHRLVEQLRERNASTAGPAGQSAGGEILRVLPERTLRRWYAP